VPARTVPVTTYGSDGKPTGTSTVTYDVSVQQDNRDTLTSQATAAMALNRTFLALKNPTVAQLTAQVQLLTQENQAVIRLLLGQLDSTN